MSSAQPPSPGSPGLPEHPERPESLAGATPSPVPAGDDGAAPRFLAPRSRPSGLPEAETAWRPWMAPVALIAAFMVALLGQLVIAAAATAFGMDIEDPTPAVNILATVFQDAAFIGAAIVFAKAAGPIRPAQFGLRRTRLWPAVGAGALTMLAFYLLSGLWAALLNIREADQLPDSFGVDESVVALIAVCILVTVIAPVAEEFLFRGFIFGALCNWRGVWPAAVLTGLIFGGIHAGSAGVEFLVPLALLGFLLCVLRWKTGSLLPPIVAHAVNNSIAFGVNQADWSIWQVGLLAVGASATCLLLVRPFLAREDDRAAVAAA